MSNFNELYEELSKLNEELSLESFNTQEQINEEQSFGDFMGNMLTEDEFAMLPTYCQNYFNSVIAKDLGAYDEKKYRYYKQRLLKKLAAINIVAEEDKKLDWMDLKLKYLSAYRLIKEIENKNIEPYKIFYALLEAENMQTWFIPDPNKLQGDKKEESLIKEHLDENITEEEI